MNPFSIPTIRTDRLILRPLRAGDLDGFAAFHADPEAMRHLGSGRTRSRAETWDQMARMLGQWALRGYGMFAVEEAATGRFAGRAGILHNFDWPAPELAYGLASPFWGKGYATEAARAVRDWAWREAGVPRLVSLVRPGNAGSIGVLRKLGAAKVEEMEVLGGPAELWEHPRPPSL